MTRKYEPADIVIGSKFGHLTIESLSDTDRHHFVCVNCRCDCGKIVNRIYHYLIIAEKSSCGCMKNLSIKKNNVDYREYIGKKFNFLTILSDMNTKDHAGSRLFECECECGKVVPRAVSKVVNGSVKSCGCMQAHIVSPEGEIVNSNFRHGMCGSDVYSTWNSMIGRCTNPKYDSWNNYGGRGITVCDRWLLFDNFYEDMGDRPLPGLSLERVDNDAGYSPENVVWANSNTQARNKRNTLFLSLNGKRKSLAEWAEITGFKPMTIRKRMVSGWSDEETLTVPIGTKYHSKGSLRALEITQ